MTDWRSSLRSDPTPWLLDNASPPIRYRVLTELLDRGRDDLDVGVELGRVVREVSVTGEDNVGELDERRSLLRILHPREESIGL